MGKLGRRSIFPRMVSRSASWASAVFLSIASGCTSQISMLGEGAHPPDVTAVESQHRRTGLALAGGGSKSAPFALGVLAGLQESGALANVDVISSVSGGSYAALYYYARLLADGGGTGDDAYTRRNRMFWDCLPADYQRLFSEPPVLWSPTNLYGLCPDRTGIYLSSNPGDGDPLAQASHLRGYQDVFGKKFDYSRTTDSRTSTAIEFSRLVGYNSVLLGIPALFANSLFDWRLEMSPSKEVYGAGIRRTYGRDATPLQPPVPTSRPDGDPHSVARMTFDSLRTIYEAGRGTKAQIPLWIINATAGTTRFKQDGDGSFRFTGEVNGFEFTPYGYGSKAFGWVPWEAKEMQPALQVAGAVGASAAFFDSQQRVTGGRYFGPLINGGLHVFNLSWGSDIPNYNKTRGQFYKGRVVHGFLPWPFYVMHAWRKTDEALYIHLSDGGQSENLGAYALLRRGITDIIVVDSASDSRYDFGDLCELDRQLLTSRVEIDALPKFSEKCGKGKNPLAVKDKLPAPVLRGRVCDDIGLVCDDENAIARLYIIKPVLNLEDPFPRLSLAQMKRDAANRNLRFGDCRAGTDAYPCEVIGFLLNNRGGPFPQHSTVRVTANSSPYIYGAYKELGRFYGRQLEIADQQERGFCLNQRWRGKVPEDEVCK